MSKGMGFSQAAGELRRLMDDAAWTACLAAMPPDTRGLIDRPPVPSQWLSVTHFLAMIDSPRRATLANWQELAFGSGRAATKKTFKTVHRIFVQMLDPGWVIRRSAPAWGSYYRDFGGPPEIVEHSPAHVLFRFHGTGAHEAFWQHIRGGMAAIGDLTRLKDPEQTLVSGGLDACDTMDLRIAWKR